MQPNLPDDRTLRRLDLERQHGSAIGGLVFDKEMAQREVEDAQCAALEAELLEVTSQLSSVSSAAAEQRLKSKSELETALAAYRKLCARCASDDSLLEATIAPLQLRALEIQRKIAAIALYRNDQRDVRNFLAYQSLDSSLLRQHNRAPPDGPSPPLSDLAQINLDAGHKRF